MTRIPITDEMRVALRHEVDRTGVGLVRFFRDIQDIPPRLNMPVARTWLEGHTKSAIEENWHWLLATYERLPDAPPGTSKWRRHMGLPPVSAKPYRRARPTRRDSVYLELTDEMHGNFLNELERTGAQLNVVSSECPGDGKRLNAATLASWKFRTAKRVRRSAWEQVMTMLTALPDRRPKVQSPKRVIVEPPAKPPAPYHAWRDDYIEITPRMRRKLQHQFERTGIGAAKLMEIAEYPPEGLNAELIAAWKNGQTKSTEPRLFNFTINVLASLPDKLKDK